MHASYFLHVTIHNIYVTKITLTPNHFICFVTHPTLSRKLREAQLLFILFITIVIIPILFVSPTTLGRHKFSGRRRGRIGGGRRRRRRSSQVLKKAKKIESFPQKKPINESGRMRSFFPESWIWTDFVLE